MSNVEFIKSLNVKELNCFIKIKSIALELNNKNLGLCYALSELSEIYLKSNILSNNLKILSTWHCIDNEEDFNKKLNDLFANKENLLFIPIDLYDLYYFSEYQHRHREHLFYLSKNLGTRYGIYDNVHINDGSTNQFEDFYVTDKMLYICNSGYRNFFKNHRMGKVSIEQLNVKSIVTKHLAEMKFNYFEESTETYLLDLLKKHHQNNNLIEEIAECLNSMICILKILSFIRKSDLISLKALEKQSYILLKSLMRESENIYINHENFWKLYVQLLNKLVTQDSSNTIKNEKSGPIKTLSDISTELGTNRIYNFNSTIDTSVRQGFFKKRCKFEIPDDIFIGDFFIGFEIKYNDFDEHFGIGNNRLIYFKRNSKTGYIYDNDETYLGCREINLSVQKNDILIYSDSANCKAIRNHPIAINLIFRNWTMTNVRFKVTEH